ncbi:unnamed protein product [Peniophora sp. CBMAI 1063]|nr:unnamed protein product [Peniophora sp. CBMAI 1063]
MRLSHKAPSPKPTRLLGTDYDRELQVLWSNDLRGGYNDHAFLDDCTAAFTSVASAARTIRELRFAARTHYAPISPLFLRHCFSSWTSVERIYAEGTIAAHCLVSALEAVPRGMEPLFPRLNELILIDAHFEQDGLGAKGALGAQLLGMLAERRDAGFALKTLRLSDVEALRRETMWWNLISDMVSVIPLHA